MHIHTIIEQLMLGTITQPSSNLTRTAAKALHEQNETIQRLTLMNAVPLGEEYTYEQAKQVYGEVISKENE